MTQLLLKKELGHLLSTLVLVEGGGLRNESGGHESRPDVHAGDGSPVGSRSIHDLLFRGPDDHELGPATALAGDVHRPFADDNERLRLPREQVTCDATGGHVISSNSPAFRDQSADLISNIADNRYPVKYQNYLP